MAGRSWFFASQGQQQGPVPEARLVELIAAGAVTAETLVWTEGMANWQRAGEIPGLGAAAAAPAMLRPGDVAARGGDSYGGDPLSIELGLWDFIWRSVALLVGIAFIIPAPWVVVMYSQWIVSSLHVPGRPNLTFTGRPVTLMWYFAALALIIGVAFAGPQWLNNLMLIVQIVLYWLLIKWFVANISSNGEPLGLSFSGSFWGYLGWNILAFVSVITIVGWAWVYTAQIRWMCGHIEGTRREVVFNATGLAFLWRSVVVFIACGFIIPIPWVMRWFIGWQVSQTALVERRTSAYA